MSEFELACYLGALAGVVTYVVNFARHRTAARLLSSSGLFFTAAAMAMLPHALDLPGSEGWIVLLFLLLAVLVYLSSEFGLEVVMGAFLAGAMVSLLDREDAASTSGLHEKLDGIGFGASTNRFAAG